MTAAVLSRSRGGLLFIFTLLCLVCLTSSLIGKEQLENLKEKIQKAEQKMDILKAEYKKYMSDFASASELMNKYVSFVDPMMALMKKSSEASADFPPLEGFVQSIMEKTRTYLDRQNEEFDANVEKAEEELEKSKKMIKFLQETQAEF